MPTLCDRGRRQGPPGPTVLRSLWRFVRSDATQHIRSDDRPGGGQRPRLGSFRAAPPPLRLGSQSGRGSLAIGASDRPRISSCCGGGRPRGSGGAAATRCAASCDTGTSAGGRSTSRRQLPGGRNAPSAGGRDRTSARPREGPRNTTPHTARSGSDPSLNLPRRRAQRTTFPVEPVVLATEGDCDVPEAGLPLAGRRRRDPRGHGGEGAAVGRTADADRQRGRRLGTIRRRGGQANSGLRRESCSLSRATMLLCIWLTRDSDRPSV